REGSCSCGVSGWGGDRLALQSFFLADAPRFLHDPGPGPRRGWGIHLFRAGDRRVVRRLQAVVNLAIFRVSPDGDWRPRHGIFPALADQEGIAAGHCSSTESAGGMAQTLGIRTMGTRRLRRDLDSVLHVLPA